ncbi:hypothetical protein B0H11DRAFT_1932060 [Mycena galericulata]|nr:hypothetical protein B0H11DRAFT_1932060 [Mycena galericulata]
MESKNPDGTTSKDGGWRAGAAGRQAGRSGGSAGGGGGVAGRGRWAGAAGVGRERRGNWRECRASGGGSRVRCGQRAVRQEQRGNWQESMHRAGARGRRDSGTARQRAGAKRGRSMSRIKCEEGSGARMEQAGRAAASGRQAIDYRMSGGSRGTGSRATRHDLRIGWWLREARRKAPAQCTAKRRPAPHPNDEREVHRMPAKPFQALGWQRTSDEQQANPVQNAISGGRPRAGPSGGWLCHPLDVSGKRCRRMEGCHIRQEPAARD